MFHLEIVIESAGHRRPEGQLHAVEQPHHRPGHDVGTRVAQQIQGLGVFAGDQAQGDLTVAGQRRIDADQPSVYFGGQRGLGQPRTDIGSNVDRSNVTRILDYLAVGKGNFQHWSPASLRAANKYEPSPPAGNRPASAGMAGSTF